MPAHGKAVARKRMMIERVSGREKDVTPLAHGKVSSPGMKIDFGSAEVPDVQDRFISPRQTE